MNGFVQALRGRDSRHEEVVMAAHDTSHKVLEREKRERMEQIEAILRRLNPELTDEQLAEMMRQFRQLSS